MNWIDWILAAIVLVSAIAAFRKGFVRELISLAALVAGLVVAALAYHRAAAWFEDLTRSHEIALAAGFLALFLLVLALGLVVSIVAAKLIKTAGLQWFDRFLGGVFGLIRGVAVDCVLLLILVAFAIKPAAVRQSRLAPYVTTGARALALVMPADLKGQFRDGFQKFREGLGPQEKRTAQEGSGRAPMGVQR